MSRRDEYNSVSEDPTWFDFILYLIFGGALGAFLFFVLTPTCHPGRELARRMFCEHQLKVIGEGMAAYAEAHDGRLPERPSQMIAEGNAEPRAFICPSAWEGLWEAAIEEAGEENAGPLIDAESDYVFIFRGIPLAALSKERIEAYELPDNHYQRGLNMMNLAGEAEFHYLDEAQWRPMVQESHDVLNKLRKEAEK